MTSCIRRKKNPSNARIEEKIAYLFDKKFAFVKPESGWPVIPPEDMFSTGIWQIPQMMNFKQELNNWKAKLNDYDRGLWHKHTRTTNPAGTVLWSIKKLIQPEFGTQAWSKFYEILSTYPVIPKNVDVLNSVHLCESPGAFITSLNHYMKLNHPEIKWDWMASSLNPHYEENERMFTIPYDTFLLCTLEKWRFGADQTGNIMNVLNMKSLCESENLQPVLLVTADGGFNCQDQPAEQEETIFPLLFCQTVTALHMLSAGEFLLHLSKMPYHPSISKIYLLTPAAARVFLGGSFVLKIFTIFEHSTISLMYFLNTCFETVHVFKPVTSKEGNSECYVVCLNYLGAEDRKPWLQKLCDFYGETLPDYALFPLEKIPEDFLEQVIQCAERFKLYQEEVIERNMFLFAIHIPATMKEVAQLRHRVAEIFREKYRLRPLKGENEEIVGKTKLEKLHCLQNDPRYEYGSFNDGLKWDQLPVKEKMSLLMGEVKKFCAPWNGNVVNWFNLWREFVPVRIVHGKPVKSVRFSKFCSCQLLAFRYKIHSLFREMQPSQEDLHFSYSENLSDELTTILMDFCPEILGEDVQIIDFQDVLLTSCLERNEEFEQKAVMVIMMAIEKAPCNSNLILVGFPLLTRVCVGFLFLWAQLFQQVGFVKPMKGSCAVILRNLHSTNREKYNFRHLLEHDKESIISIVPINELVDNQDFYAQVVAANSFTLKNELTRKYVDLTCNFYNEEL